MAQGLESFVVSLISEATLLRALNLYTQSVSVEADRTGRCGGFRRDKAKNSLMKQHVESKECGVILNLAIQSTEGVDMQYFWAKSRDAQLLIHANPALELPHTSSFTQCILEIRDDPVSVNCIMSFARVIAVEFSAILRNTLTQLRERDNRGELPPLYKHPLYVRTPFTRIPSNILASIFDVCRQFTDTRDSLTDVFGCMMGNLAYPLVQLSNGDTWAMVRVGDKVYLAPRRLIVASLKSPRANQFDRICLDPDGVQFLMQILHAEAWTPHSVVFQLLCHGTKSEPSDKQLDQA